MNLSDAITATEQAGAAYQSAAATTASDQQAAANIQAKLDVATEQVTADKQDQSEAAAAFNGALDQLIQVATSAKIPV